MYFLIVHRSLTQPTCWYFIVHSLSPRDAYVTLAKYIEKRYGLTLSPETMQRRFTVLTSQVHFDVLEIPPFKGTK